MAKVLVVEDNPSNLDLALEILHFQGYDTAVVTTGRECLAAVQREMPDLILMDLQLPGIDGLSLTKMIRKNSGTSHIPVLALTAHANRDIREKAFKAGCNAFMEKPIRLETFRAAVKELLGSADLGAARRTGQA